MFSRNHLLACCMLLATLMIVHAQHTHDGDDAPSSYFTPPSMDSREASLPSSHRSLGAAYYKRSPPPPPPKKAVREESGTQTGI
ncbi:uncharacterized protein LOC17882314 [Capsella rubella]|uniref:uncharacterized protein LOC17882314 n=1 Tax=Capsella rubella TaxID=81985 RepID=UPI000CD4C9B5|nr:uncharacterized protein LOC17882314 [Capsella rubella]